jgi:hypothetical protein
VREHLLVAAGEQEGFRLDFASKLSVEEVGEYLLEDCR